MKNNKCYACSSNCDVCSSETVCTTCKSGYFLKNNVCVLCDSTNKPNCATCSPTSNKCTKCIDKCNGCYPKLIKVSDTHYVSCYLYDKGDE